MTTRNSVKKSNIWTCFVISNENSSYAKCNEDQCNKSISRGTCVKQYSTKPLWNHLKFKHRDKYKMLAVKKLLPCQNENTEIPIIEQTDESLSLEQEIPIIDSSETLVNKKSKWKPNNKKCKAITNAICELMAVEAEPYELVNREGFKKLMSIITPNYYLQTSSYFESMAMPQFYNTVKDEIQKGLDEAKFISFTSDILTNNAKNVSFINLCVHLIDSSMSSVCYTLKCQQLPVKYDDHIVLEVVSNVINEWIIDETKMHVFMMDRALSTFVSIGFTRVEKVSCVLHEFKLIVHDVLFAKKLVNEEIKKCKDIVNHFEHPSFNDETYNVIRESLIEAGLIGQIEKSDCFMEFYIFQRLCELRETICTYAKEGNISNMTESEWNLIRILVDLLKPIVDMVESYIRENEIISCIIPMMQSLYSYLKKRCKDETEMNLIKYDLKKSVEINFLEGENNLQNKKVYVLSTVLDPRFKIDFIDNEERARKWLLIDMINQNELVPIMDDVKDIENVIIKEEEEETINDTEGESQEFWSCFHELANGIVSDESGINVENTIPVTTPEKRKLYIKEIDDYLNIPIIDRDFDPLLWWKSHENDFPNLKLCMLKYLSVPSTLYYEQACHDKVKKHLKNVHHLLPYHIETLMFLGRNSKGL